MCQAEYDLSLAETNIAPRMQQQGFLKGKPPNNPHTPQYQKREETLILSEGHQRKQRLQHPQR
jgi:hypothetical protein